MCGITASLCTKKRKKKSVASVSAVTTLVCPPPPPPPRVDTTRDQAGLVATPEVRVGGG